MQQVSHFLLPDDLLSLESALTRTQHCNLATVSQLSDSQCFTALFCHELIREPVDLTAKRDLLFSGPLHVEPVWSPC